MIEEIIKELTLDQNAFRRFFFPRKNSESELERICEFIEEGASKEISFLLEPESRIEQKFVKSIVQELRYRFKVFTVFPKTEIKDLLNQKNKNSLISCYEKGEKIFLIIKKLNSDKSEKVYDLITKLIKNQQIYLSEFDSNNNSVVKKGNNFSLVVIQNFFSELKGSSKYQNFSYLFQRLRLFDYEILLVWINYLESRKQGEGLLRLLKDKRESLGSFNSLKRSIEGLFRNETSGFGDKDFTENKYEDSLNLYKILPRFHLYFDISKNESIEFLKNGGFENLKNLKNQIAEVVPSKDFKITDLRIGSIDLEFVNKAEDVKDYLQKIANGEDTKDFEVKFNDLLNVFSKKTFKFFNNKDLKASAQVFYLDNSKKEEIKKCLEEGSKYGLTKTIDMLVNEITKEVLKRGTHINRNVSNIKKAIDNMISSNNYNKQFKEELEEAKKDTIFEYAVTGLPIIFKDSRKYEEAKAKCENRKTKILFHGTKVDPAAAIVASQFKAYDGIMGEGVYFSDMLDLVRCYSLGTTSIPRPGESFYVVGSEIFFDEEKAKRVDKTIQGQRKKTEKNGIHYGLTNGFFNSLVSDLNINSLENSCIGREYMISFAEQINPIYGIKLKRSEYCIIWRDPNFNENLKKDDCRKYIEKLKTFIEEDVGYNLYIEKSTESALRLVKKKIYNKIILVSNIGSDSGGKHFVEEARKIIGCNAFTLFSSYSELHLRKGWLQNFGNALFSNEEELSKEILKDFSIDGLRNSKKMVEEFYECDKFRDFEEVNYVHYVESGDINKLNCEGFELYKHKFL